MKLTVLCIFVFFIQSFVFSQDQYLAFDRITVDQGLSQGVVNTIAQDKQGFIWFGTSEGLNRYDGYNVKVFKNDPNVSRGLSGNSILALAVDGDRLWIGLEDYGLDMLDLKTGFFQNFTSESHGLVGNTVRRLHLDSKGFLWIGGLDGLNRFYNGDVITFPWDPDDPLALPEKSISCLFEDNGFLYVGTKQGLSRLDLSDQTAGFTQINELKGKSVISIDGDGKDSLWVGAIDGLYLVNLSTNETKVYSEPFPTGGVLAVLRDHGDHLWVGSNEGLYLYSEEDDHFSVYRHNPGDLKSIGGNSIKTFFEDKNGILWMGHFGEGVSKYNNLGNGFTSYQLGTTGGILSFEEDQDNGFWIGTMSDGVFHSLNGELTQYLHDPEDPNSMKSNRVFDIHQGGDGSLWFSTMDGLELFMPKTRTFKHFHIESNVEIRNLNVFTGIYEDANGLLWVSSFAGLALFNKDNGSFTRYVHDENDRNSLGSNSLWDVTGDKEGNIWVGTVNGGVNKFNPESGKIKKYEYNSENTNSLSNNDVNVIFPSNDGVFD